MQVENSKQNFTSLKLHILELLYSTIINKAFDNAVEYISKIILNSDSFFHKIRSHYGLFSKILIAAINSFLIFKTNSTFGEFVLNFIKIDTNKADLISDKSNRNRLIGFLILEHLVPLLIELIPKIITYLNFSRFFTNKFTNYLKQFLNSVRLIKILIDLAYKLKYIFDKDFLYFDSISNLLNMMIVNKGSKGVFSEKFLNVGRQLNLFFLFMFVRLGEWYYKKEIKNEENEIEIEAPEKLERVITSICPLCKSRLDKDIIAVKCCGCVYCQECVKRLTKESSNCYVCGNSIDEQDLVKIFN